MVRKRSLRIMPARKWGLLYEPQPPQLDPSLSEVSSVPVCRQTCAPFVRSAGPESSASAGSFATLTSLSASYAVNCRIACRSCMSASGQAIVAASWGYWVTFEITVMAGEGQLDSGWNTPHSDFACDNCRIFYGAHLETEPSSTLRLLRSASG